MFRIADGREYFYQWDLDRRILVEDPSIVEVHFCNRTDECSLVVETYTDDTYDGKVYANVPNIILQNSFDIRVFAYDGKATRFDEVFKVKPRTRPADYMYTETVIKSIDELLDIAEKTTAMANEVYEYVEEHQLDFTDDGKGNVELNVLEVNGEGEIIIPGDPFNSENYYTKEEVDELLSNINECDTYFFNPYEVEWQTGLTPTYASEHMAEFAKRFLAGEGVSLYIAWQIPDTLEIRWYPAEIYKLSDSQVGFTRCISVYDFGREIVNQSYIIKQVTEGVWRYNKALAEVQFLPDKKYVDDAIAAINIPEGGNVDLTGYATEDWVKDQGYLTEHQNLDEYAKKTEIPDISGKADKVHSHPEYLTEHQSLAGYATETYVGTAIQNALNNIGVAEGGAY
jgi:hypothetical protein